MTTEITKLLNHDWLENASIDDIKTEIKNCANINITNEDGDTPLLIAIQYRCSLDIIQALLDAGADVNAKCGTSMHTPLMAAVFWGGIATFLDGSEVLNLLIKYGADINAKDWENETPLVWAYNNIEATQILLNNNADINVKNDMDIPIFHKISRLTKYPEIIKMLIKHGADINAKDTIGETALMRAALFNKNPQITQTLIEEGADIYARNDFGENIVDIAKNNENSEVYELVKRYYNKVL